MKSFDCGLPEIWLPPTLFCVGYAAPWLLFSFAATSLQYGLESSGLLNGMMMWSSSTTLSAGLLLLAGLALFAADGRGFAFEAMSLSLEEGGLDLAALALFFAFGIKAAFPFLHNWLQDSYPKASVTGSVVLSAFTTKLAVYALARGFPGR